MYHFRPLTKLTNMKHCSYAKRFIKRHTRFTRTALNINVSKRKTPTKSIEMHAEKQERKYSDAFYSGFYAIVGTVVGGGLLPIVLCGIDYCDEWTK